MKPLRFCMVTTFYPPYNFGGDGLFVQNLSVALAQNGHHVEVIHCADSYRVHAAEPTEQPEEHAGIRVHTLRSPFGILSPLATQLSGRSFFKTAAIATILASKFDVIHYHNISLIGANVPGLGQAIKLYTPHEYWLVCPTHTLFKFNREACERPQCTLCSLAHKRPPQFWRKSGLLNSAMEDVDAFLFLSRTSQELHERAGLRSPAIHLPGFVRRVEAPGATAGEVRAGDQRPYFLFVGRLEKLKGLQSLIPIFRRRPQERLLIAGEGGMGSELTRLAEGASNIEFLNQVSAERLVGLYRQAVAVIVPSITYEVFPLVIIEAFREGTPVLARSIGGPKEVLEESGGGLLFDTDDGLETLMDRLLANPQLRNDLGLRGRQAYQQKWTQDSHLQRYLSIIEEISGRRSAYRGAAAATRAAGEP
jgi:glycosyltransferase involved in cell wall biosynthesis